MEGRTRLPLVGGPSQLGRELSHQLRGCDQAHGLAGAEPEARVGGDVLGERGAGGLEQLLVVDGQQRGADCGKPQETVQSGHKDVVVVGCCVLAACRGGPAGRSRLQETTLRPHSLRTVWFFDDQLIGPKPTVTQ